MPSQIYSASLLPLLLLLWSRDLLVSACDGYMSDACGVHLDGGCICFWNATEGKCRRSEHCIGMEHTSSSVGTSAFSSLSPTVPSGYLRGTQVGTLSTPAGFSRVKSWCGWSTHAGKYSSEYASGVSTAFATLDDAKSKCIELGDDVCKAITCASGGTCTVRASASLKTSPSGETTFVPAECFQVACRWSMHTAKYSGEYAGGVSTAFTKLDDAKSKCTELGEDVCKAVTCASDGPCTVRASSSLKTSPAGEVTYVPTATCFLLSSRPSCIPSVSSAFHSRNSAGLYAIGPNGAYKQVTDFSGRLMHSLDDLGDEFYNKSLKKVVIYAHGRQDKGLEDEAEDQWAFTDGFCRQLDGSQYRDYAKSMRDAGFNALLWYWAQYSFSPCGQVLEDHFLTCLWRASTVVSPKIWADVWIREQETMKGGGNPTWAKFPEGQRGGWHRFWGTNYLLEKTSINGNTGDIRSIERAAVGYSFAESIQNIASSLADVEALHFVGNSYGSQVVLHGAYLILKQLEKEGASAPNLIRALPTRLVLLDPAYKTLATASGHNILQDLAMPQLRALHLAGIPVLSLHASAIASDLIGTRDTSPFSHYALSVNIKMNVSWMAAHTACVDWYFQTYTPEDGANCAIPRGAKALMFGCMPDSDARQNIKDMIQSQASVFQLKQNSVPSGSPWSTEWETHEYCKRDGSCLEKLKEADPLFTSVSITGCTSASLENGKNEGQFKCIFALEWDDSAQQYSCGSREILTQDGHQYTCNAPTRRNSPGSLCKQWCNNLPTVEGCTQVIRKNKEEVKCIFPKDAGKQCDSYQKKLWYNGQPLECYTPTTRWSNWDQCKVRCKDRGGLVELLPSMEV